MLGSSKISHDEKDLHQVLHLIHGLQAWKERQEAREAVQEEREAVLEERVAALEKENKELREVGWPSSGSASHPPCPPDRPSAASAAESEEQVESLAWALRALFLLVAIPTPLFYLLLVVTKDSYYRIMGDTMFTIGMGGVTLFNWSAPREYSGEKGRGPSRVEGGEARGFLVYVADIMSCSYFYRLRLHRLALSFDGPVG